MLSLEIWKDIPGYEGYYQASNLGRIKRLGVLRFCGSNKKLGFFKEKILKFKNHIGYRVFVLRKEKIRK